MAYLTLNGITIPVADGSGSRSLVYTGSAGDRAFSGQGRKTNRGRKSEWRFHTVPIAQADSVAFQGLINGQGEHWTFDTDYFSTRGLGPTLSSSPQLSGAATGAPFTTHGKYLFLSGFTTRITWNLGGLPAWSWFGSAYFPPMVWAYALARSDGAKWCGGTRDDTLDFARFLSVDSTGLVDAKTAVYGGRTWAPNITVAVGDKAQDSGSGTIALECTQAGTTGTSQPVWSTTPGAIANDGTAKWKTTGSAQTRVGDLVVVPYRVPDSWEPQLRTWHTSNPWSALPYLTAAGSFSSTSVTVRGEVVGVESVPLNGGVGETIEFVLREV